MTKYYVITHEKLYSTNRFGKPDVNLSILLVHGDLNMSKYENNRINYLMQTIVLPILNIT